MIAVESEYESDYWYLSCFYKKNQLTLHLPMSFPGFIRKIFGSLIARKTTKLLQNVPEACFTFCIVTEIIALKRKYYIVYFFSLVFFHLFFFIFIFFHFFLFFFSYFTCRFTTWFGERERERERDAQIF